MNVSNITYSIARTGEGVTVTVSTAQTSKEAVNVDVIAAGAVGPLKSAGSISAVTVIN